jgi:DNA-binding Xre family transcriptional regulator
MVTLRIRAAAEARGVTSSYQLMKLMNIPPGHASRLWKGGMEMIGLKTIDALCEALGCDPSDLIVREDSAAKRRRKPSS